MQGKRAELMVLLMALTFSNTDGLGHYATQYDTDLEYSDNEGIHVPGYNEGHRYGGGSEYFDEAGYGQSQKHYHDDYTSLAPGYGAGSSEAYGGGYGGMEEVNIGYGESVNQGYEAGSRGAYGGGYEGMEEVQTGYGESYGGHETQYGAWKNLSSASSSQVGNISVSENVVSFLDDFGDSWVCYRTTQKTAYVTNPTQSGHQAGYQQRKLKENQQEKIVYEKKIEEKGERSVISSQTGYPDYGSRHYKGHSSHTNGPLQYHLHSGYDFGHQ